MKKNAFLLLIALVLPFYIQSKTITTVPSFVTNNTPIEIIFDANGTALDNYNGTDVYAHTGVITDKSTSDSDWKYAPNWLDNSAKYKLEPAGDNKWKLNITPTIQTYYNVPADEKIIKLAFVFRNSDGSKEGKENGKDILVDVKEEGLQIEFETPTTDQLIDKNESLFIKVNSSQNTTLSLLLNEDLLASSDSATSISYNHTFSKEGSYWLIAEAGIAPNTIRDSIYINVTKDQTYAPLPQNVRAGINYIDDNSTTFVLYAPEKNNIYIIGDFNNWKISNDYMLSRDGDYWWITVSDMEKGKEYAFQYLIDGELKVADPYTNKVLDPWNDPYIPTTVYPNLKTYPTGKTEGIVSIAQTGKVPYQWKNTSYSLPSKEKMVIYELHIRDFTKKHSFASTLEKLDYLEALGINTIELLPINEFEGNSSWGYNPSFYFAVDKYYGTEDAFKSFVDECHTRGIAVIIDMVLNHSYGQSPFAQMYWDNANNRPATNNPWYNAESPNKDYSWGSDFNHESEQTKALVDSINSFWMNEYKVDGFRFDFTKGFTNTPGDGWAYDQSRINILKRMTNEIYQRNPNAYVIMEHLAENQEEIALSDADIMLWGNMNHNYCEAIMGYNEDQKSDLAWSIFSERGWSKPNLISYMESHDEERLMYKAKTWGDSIASYNTKDLPTALTRSELSAAFYLILPGPKMIWQFGELGYDYSINTCSDSVTISDECRVAEKPIRWDYLEDTNRKALYEAYAKLIQLKTDRKIFESSDLNYSLTDATKYIIWKSSDENAFLVGNFGVIDATVSITLPHSGLWYNAISGDSIELSTTDQTFNLNPGEYRLYIDRSVNIPAETTWTPQDGSTDWTLASNWSNGVPGETSRVTIPQSTSYPELKNDSVKIDIIYFETGAELKGQNMLVYNKAFVDYGFDKGERSTHFRTRSLPLKEAYPADFTFGSQPSVYLQVLEIDTVTQRGKFTSAKGGNIDKLTAGSGFVISLDPDKDSDKGLAFADGILRLPYFDTDANVDSAVHPTHVYDGNGKSTFSNPNNPSQTYDVTRSADSYTLASSITTVPCNFVPSGEQFITLVGNPFMTTIDFSKFQEQNSELIKNNYQIWTKEGDIEGYAGYNPEGNFGLILTPELNRNIAPLQGIFVEQNGTTTGSLIFDLSAITSDTEGSLRNIPRTDHKINIIAKNEKASVSTFIAKRDNGSKLLGSADSRKLINSINDAPEVYTIKQSEKANISVGANIINNDDVEYPIGIATTLSGQMSLTFSGMNNYNANILFTDKALNKTINLSGIGSYEYTFNYIPNTDGTTTSPTEDRFNLRITSATSSANDPSDLNEKESLIIYTDKGFIHVSTNYTNTIKEITIYNLSGMLVYHATINDSSYVTSKSFMNGVYIVKVKTDNGLEHKKVFIE